MTTRLLEGVSVSWTVNWMEGRVVLGEVILSGIELIVGGRFAALVVMRVKLHPPASEPASLVASSVLHLRVRCGP